MKHVPPQSRGPWPFILLFLLAGALAVLLIFPREGESPRQLVERMVEWVRSQWQPPEPVPEPTPVPTPGPVPEPTPEPVPTPSAEETAWQWLRENKQYWPAEVKLVVAREFPVEINGEVKGATKLPAGTAGSLQELGADTVTAVWAGAPRQVPKEATDIVSLAMAVYKERLASGEVTPPPVSTPVAAKPSSAPLRTARGESTKRASVTVTAEMRANAMANTEKYDWAAQRVRHLRDKLSDYLAASDEFLWEMLPSSTMPRYLGVAVHREPVPESEMSNPAKWHTTRFRSADVGPPGSGDKLFSVPMEAPGGWGTKYWYDIDPFRHPWKVKCRGTGQWYPKNDFASYYRSALDKDGNFHPGRGDARFLKSDGPPGTETWVDDGYGMPDGQYTFLFAAHYAFKVWQQAIDVVLDLSELYTLTSDPTAAHKAGVLLARMAELYPGMSYSGVPFKKDQPLTGGVQDYIWECWTAERLSLGYDRVFDYLVGDQALADFVASKETPGRPMTPRQVAAGIEDNLLREFAARIKDRRIRGNMGMHQSAMVAAAIALDNGNETTGMLDWLFDPEGGDLPGVLVEGMSRDGRGVEQGLGYSFIPARETFKLARLLELYPQYERSDLFSVFPKLRNSLAAGERIRLNIGSVANVGDGGQAMWFGQWGMPAPVDMALEGFLRDGQPENARELFFAAQGNAARLPRDIYAADPEAKLAPAIEAIARLNREYADPKDRIGPSFVSGGYGLAALQAPGKNPRTLALNFGPMGHGHGHGDRLGLHLFSHGVQMATDLGYPAVVENNNPERVGWVSHIASHNTVMVDDEQIRLWSNFSGKVRLFAEAGPVRVMDIDGGSERTLRGGGHTGPKGHQWAKSEARRPYPQVKTYRRCVVMVDVDDTDSYYLDLFWVRGGRTHRLIQNGGGPAATSDWPDWTKQAAGTLAGEKVAFGEMAQPVSFANQGSGLSWLRDVERATPDRPFWVDWKIVEMNRSMPPDFRAHLRVHNLAPVSEAALATGITPRTAKNLKELRYFVRTVKGARETQFATVLEPYGQEPFVKAVRFLESTPPSGQFGAAVEVTLTDGRVDRLFVTEEGGVLRAGEDEMEGRVAWLRRDADGAVLDWALVDAVRMEVAGAEFAAAQPAAFTGKIVSINDTDPINVIVGTSLGELPPDLAGRYLLVDNHQRADASYRIKEVLPEGKLNIGAAALDELLVDPSDPGKGRIRNIAPGETFRIANPARRPEG